MRGTDNVSCLIERIRAGAAGREAEAAGKEPLEIEHFHWRIVHRMQLKLLGNQRLVCGADGIPAPLNRSWTFLHASRGDRSGYQKRADGNDENTKEKHDDT